jgi:hypothetical protein
MVRVEITMLGTKGEKKHFGKNQAPTLLELWWFKNTTHHQKKV